MIQIPIELDEKEIQADFQERLMAYIKYNTVNGEIQKQKPEVERQVKAYLNKNPLLFEVDQTAIAKMVQQEVARIVKAKIETMTKRLVKIEGA